MKQIISTDSAPQAIGTYSQAVKIDKTVYVSGQLGLDPKTMNLVGKSFKEQTHQVFRNLEAIAKTVDCSLNNFVKFNVYLTDLKNFAAFNEIAEQFLTSPYPARAAVEVCALPKGGIVEVEGIIVVD
jgi:reactive intermediate/imine deaminase